MFKWLAMRIPISGAGMAKETLRIDRAEQLAQNPVVGAVVDTIAWTENKIKNVVSPQSNAQPNEQRPKRSRFGGNHAQSIADGLQEYLYSVLRPGLSIAVGGRRIVVDGSVFDAATPGSIVVRSGVDYYAVDIDVAVTVLELEDIRE